MAEIILSDANFEQEVLQSTVPVFVDFWAPWCGPCQMMGPIIEEFAHEYDVSKIKIGKLNVDDNQVTSGTYNVMSIPTFLLFQGGQVIDQVVGGVSKERLQEMIAKHI